MPSNNLSGKSGLDFVVVGPMKTGTSWIHSYLQSHPDVAVPTQVKETFYFTSNYEKGESWFDTQFGDRDTAVNRRGEVGPTYFAEALSISRIKALSPACQIIVVLREPVERFTSHYRHLTRAGRIQSGTPIDVSFKENERLFEQSLYYKHICRWISEFGVEQVSVLSYEELAAQPAEFADRLCRKIGIESLPIPQHLTSRIGAGQTPKNKLLLRLTKKVKKRLRRLELHGLVNLGKQLGIRRMLYHQKRDTDVAVDLVGVADAFAMIEEDLSKLESLGIDTSHWQIQWQKLGLVSS